MLYLFDEDTFGKAAELGYITSDPYKKLVTWYRTSHKADNSEVNITGTDIVCYHNSFPVGKKDLLTSIIKKHDTKPDFMEERKKFLKIGKDKFYINFRQYVDDGYQLESLKFGPYTVLKEMEVVRDRMFAMLFDAADDSLLDLKMIHPPDLRKICRLAGTDYNEVLSTLQDNTVKYFRNTIKKICKNA
jgi:hypothetical protein